MLRSGRTIALTLFALFLAVDLVGGLVWANLNFTQRFSGGQDFIGVWKGAQNFLMQGVTPYGELTTLNVETLVYGHEAHAGQAPMRVNEPFHIVLLFIPLGAVQDLTLARAIWMVLLEIALAGLVWVAVSLSQWQPKAIPLILLLLFGLLWAPGLSSLLRGDVIIVQTLLIFGALRALDSGIDELAGAFLFLALFQVEATGLLVLLLFFWTTLQRRWRVWGGFLMLLVVFLGIGLVLLPAWPLQYLRAVMIDWLGSTSPTSYQLFESWFPGLGLRFAQMLTIGGVLLLLVEWVAAREKDVRSLFWTLALTAVVTPLLGLPYQSNWLVLSVPAIVLVLSIMSERWGGFGRWLALLLLVGLFISFLSLGAHPAIFLLAFPLGMIVLLYWVRWWAVRRPRLWVDTLTRIG